jgi:hypothetical protein
VQKKDSKTPASLRGTDYPDANSEGTVDPEQTVIEGKKAEFHKCLLDAVYAVHDIAELDHLAELFRFLLVEDYYGAAVDGC